VNRAGGARAQLTFFSEPIGGLQRQPGGDRFVFTMDAGGSEFSQVFLMASENDDAILLTDGKSRNGSVVWDREGKRIAYHSTLRNGASNDLWLMDVDHPESARIVLQSPDGTSWRPIDFSQCGRWLLVQNYVSNMDSRIHLLDLESGQLSLLAGGPGKPDSNQPFAFDQTDTGIWYVTDQDGEFRRLAWRSLRDGAGPEYLTTNIPWHVSNLSISDDRRRGAFTVNENGLSSLYLLNLETREFRLAENILVGVLRKMAFSPDGRSLAMSLNTAKTPSDIFVLALGDDPLASGELERWTFSETGGLDTDSFISPELVHYPTFDLESGVPRRIPAWVYMPEGEGPFPVIIAIHGGPESQARPTFNSAYQMWLRKLGVAVIRPNVRGSSGFGKTYQSLDNGYLREDSVRDIGALLDWIDGRAEFDSSRIAVIGGSYGGYMALATATHYSDRLKAVVDRVGISSFVTFLENTQAYRRDLRRAEYGDERDPAMRSHLEKISPLTNVEKIAVPMLVVQGQNDPRVPVTEAQQIVAALRAQNQPVWFMNAMNEGHGYRKKENRDKYQQVTMLFFQRYLLGD
jgi:dipeptidyl aminopeptidase/acylaminoacyl peptidase